MIKNQNMWIVITVVIILFATLREYFYVSDTLKEEKLKNHLTNQKVFDTVVQLQKEKIKTTSELLISMESIKEAFHEDDANLIFDVVGRFWEKIKDKNLLYEIHFFKPPAISFANLSNFSTNQGDVSDVRKDIVHVTNSMQSSAHIMMCKTYAGIRGTYPIIDNNEVIGGLSLGEKIDWLPSMLKELTENNSFLVYEKESTKNLVPSYRTFFFKDKKIINDKILADETIDISKKIFEGIDFSKPLQDIVIENKRYSLSLIEIKDFETNIFAYSGILYDLEPLYEAITYRILRDALILFIVALLIYLLVSRRLKSMENELVVISDLTTKIRENRFDEIENEKTEVIKEIRTYTNLTKDIFTLGDSLKAQLHHKDEILIQQSKFAALSEMLDNIAHQWRQPLSFISTNASSIQLKKEMGMEDEKDEDKKLQDIVDTTSELSQTIDDFRSFLNEEKTYEHFKIKDAVKRTNILTEVVLEKYHIKVIYNIGEEEINGVLNQLTQVIINLINNAKDQLISQENEKYIKIDVNHDDNNIYISVHDSGNGVPNAIIGKLFQGKITTKVDGIGIGLLITKNILKENFNAEISVSNEIFKIDDKEYFGARFLIVLPK